MEIEAIMREFPYEVWVDVKHAFMMPKCRAAITLILALAGCPSWPVRADNSPQDIAITPPLEVTMISRESWDRSTPEKSYFGVYTANKKADRQWIVDTFVPEERDAIRKLVGDRQLLDANTRLFESINKETITKKIAYRGYVILIIEALRSDGRRFLRYVPMKLAGRDWLLTNDLASDKVFLNLKSGYVDR